LRNVSKRFGYLLSDLIVGQDRTHYCPNAELVAGDLTDSHQTEDLLHTIEGQSSDEEPMTPSIMAALGRRTHYRKHLTDQVLFDLPVPNEETDHGCKIGSC
jgi:hypothetical protein